MTASILLMDDDEDVGTLLELTLRKGKIRNPLLRALSPDEGLTLLNTLDELPCLVLLDLHFPGQMPGTEILKLIRMNPRTHSLCVFILSISSAQEAAAKIASTGMADRFIQKPVALAKLLSAAADCGVKLEIGGEAS